MSEEEILKQKYIQIDKAMGILEDLAMEVYQTDHEESVMVFVDSLVKTLTYEDDV